MKVISFRYMLLDVLYKLLINEEVFESEMIQNVELVIEGLYDKKYVPILNM